MEDETGLEETKKIVRSIIDELKKKTIIPSARDIEFIQSISVKMERYGISVKQKKWIMDIYNTHLGWGESVDKHNSKKINRVDPDEYDLQDKFNRLNRPSSFKDDDIPY